MGQVGAGGGVEDGGAPRFRLRADVVTVAADVTVDGHGAMPGVLSLAGHDQAGDDAGLLVVHREDCGLAEAGERVASGVPKVPHGPGPAGGRGEVGEPAGGGEQVVQVAGSRPRGADDDHDRDGLPSAGEALPGVRGPLGKGCGNVCALRRCGAGREGGKGAALPDAGQAGSDGVHDRRFGLPSGEVLLLQSLG